jgi:hypothetical protein
MHMNTTTWANCTEHGRTAPVRETYTDWKMLGGRRVGWEKSRIERDRSDNVRCGECSTFVPALSFATSSVATSECNDICTSARGRKCECKCQGQNHGGIAA